MLEDSRIFKALWAVLKDVIIPLAVGASAVYVAYQANQIAEMQVLLAKTAGQPLFEIYAHSFDEPDSLGTAGYIDISVLEGRYSNYSSGIRSFLVCSYRPSGTDPSQTVPDRFEIPIEDLVYLYAPSHSLYGTVETIWPFQRYDLLKDLMDSAKEYCLYQEPGLMVSVSVESCLRITYTNLLNETETVYFLVNSSEGGVAHQLDEEYGAKLFQKWMDMCDGGFGIALESKPAASDLLQAIDRINTDGTQYKTPDTALFGP